MKTDVKIFVTVIVSMVKPFDKIFVTVIVSIAKPFDKID